MKFGSAGGIILVAIIAIGVWIMWMYNNFIGLDEKVDALGAQVQSMYERRTDLVPQLAAVVKNYAKYEQGTLEGVTRLRQDAQNLDLLQKMITEGKAQSPEFGTLLGSTMGSLKISVEAYPDLKADQQFIKLFDSLEGSENRIRVSIKDYNDYLIEYNGYLRRFPTNVVLGSIFGYKAKDRLTPPEDKDIKSVPNVDSMLDMSK